MLVVRPLFVLSLLAPAACTAGKDVSDDTGVATDAVADTDAPDTDSTASDTDDLDSFDTDVPDTDVSDTDVPDTDVPDTDVPDTDVPDTDDLDTDSLDTDSLDTDDTDSLDTDVSSYSLRAVVTGVAGAGLVLRAGDQRVEVAEDGAYLFPDGLLDGSRFEVVVAANPICPAQACSVTHGSGSVSAADVEVGVSCSDARMRLYTSSWSDDQVRITDDFDALADAATASPRILGGSAVGIVSALHDSVAVDASRDLLYIADSGGEAVLVWEHASTLAGDVAPDRVFTLPSLERPEGIEIDSVHDRIYVGGPQSLFAFNGASTLTGAATPDATLPGGTIALSLDRLSDRLFIAAPSDFTVLVLDDASTLSGSLTAARTIYWASTQTGFSQTQALVVDACSDRLYLGSNRWTPNDASLVAFDGASTLDGVVNLDNDSVASRTSEYTLHLLTDGSGGLYDCRDSATQIRHYAEADTWVGAAARTPTRSILGAMYKGYGGELVAY